MPLKRLLSHRQQPKVFCIGRNKTGTTSMAHALRTLGYRVGNQAEAELFMDDWAKRDFRRIINYCKTADAFQDNPFSLDYTYQAMDISFPGSKFILTMRESAEEWYESLIRFHTKIVGKNRIPTPDDLKQFSYRYIGWIWHVQQLTYNIDETNLYDKNIYIQHYNRHNYLAMDYFKHRPEDLLIIKISDPSSMEKLCKFLGKEYTGQILPHLNPSQTA